MPHVEQRPNWFDGDLSNAWPRDESNVVPSTENFDVYRYEFPDSLGQLGWQDSVRVLANAVMMAPTSHNMQQFVLKADAGDRILKVFPDDRFIGIPADETGRQTYVSVGNVLEYAVAFLNAYGVVPNVEFNTEDNPHSGVAHAELRLDDLQSGELVNPNLINLMKMRRVYRGPFERRIGMSDSVAENMLDHAAQMDLDLRLITGRRGKTALGLIQYAANNVVLHRKLFRQELGEFLLPNDTAEGRGMPGSTFGLSDEDAMEAHTELRIGEKLQGKFASGFPRADKEAIISSAAVGVIVAPEDSEEYWMKAGMLMSRLWLYLQSEGYGMGVMSGMVEVAGKARSLMKVLGVDGVPLSVFRTGKPLKDSWPRSPRVNIDEVLTFEE